MVPFSCDHSNHTVYSQPEIFTTVGSDSCSACTVVVIDNRNKQNAQEVKKKIEDPKSETRKKEAATGRTEEEDSVKQN